MFVLSLKQVMVFPCFFMEGNPLVKVYCRNEILQLSSP